MTTPGAHAARPPETKTQRSIRTLDGRLLVASERLTRYRVTGPSSSVIVQQHVVDRMLDERLILMKERDRG